MRDVEIPRGRAHTVFAGQIAATPRGATWIFRRGRIAATPRGATRIFRGHRTGYRHRSQPAPQSPDRREPRPKREEVPGCHVELSGLEGQAVPYGVIKAEVSKIAPVRFVDVNEDDGTAMLACDLPASASKIADELKEIDGAACEAVVLEPAREEAYKKEAAARRDERRAAQRDRGDFGHNRKGGGGGRPRGN